MENIGSKKKILKNTMILYIRMLFTMLIALYTSRIVLKALGIEDYGLYNVVGGVVGLFSFLKTSLASATQRFLSFELGRAIDVSESHRVFCASISTHLLIAFVIFLFCESIGLWFLNTQVNIPEGRVYVANVIYHFSVVAICVSMLNVPYHACVISHEDMSFFAFISILDAMLKLFIAIFITYLISSERLIYYGFLIMLITIVNLIIYNTFCRRKYDECHFEFRWDKTMVGRIFGFSSWTLIGQLAVIASNHGASILVNIFYSVTANAAIGVAQQVNHSISGLVANFQTAYQPQITKSYAAHNYEYQQALIMQASKVSYFLMFIVALPVIFNIDNLLNIWLDKVPQYTSQFCIYFMAASMLNAIGGPLWMSVFATGNIRNYQIATSIAYLLDIILVYILFKLGFPPVTAVAVKVFINGLVVFIRMWYCKQNLSSFSAWQFTLKVLLPIIISSLLSISFGIAAFSYSDTTLKVIMSTIATFLFAVAISYSCGLNSKEKVACKKLLTRIIKRQ